MIRGTDLSDLQAGARLSLLFQRSRQKDALRRLAEAFCGVALKYGKRGEA